MEDEIPFLKRRGSITAHGVARGGGGGEGYLETVTALAADTRRRCVSGCGMPADALIPAQVIIDKAHLKRFLYKMMSDDKEKCERLLDAFADDAKAAQNSYRISRYHLDGGGAAVPAGGGDGEGGGGGAAAATAAAGHDVFMLSFSPAGRTPTVFPQPTPSILSYAPGKDEDAKRLLSQVKAKLSSDEFAGVETIIEQLRMVPARSA